jgi:hypothetical protein
VHADGVGDIAQGHRPKRRYAAVEVTLLAPEWSGPVTLFRVFAFAPDRDAVVRLNDCIDESYALQVLVA